MTAIRCIRPRLVVGLGLVVLASCGGEERPSRPAQSAPTEGLRSVNGTQLFVKEIGAGDPLVVVHGGPGMEHSYLLPGLDVLEGDARLFFYDQRGVGHSVETSDDTPVSIDQYLVDLDSVRRIAGSKVDVLAHSWGGLLGMLFAARYPESVRSLILVGTVEPGRRFAAQTAQRQAERRTAEDAAMMDSLMQSPGFAAREPASVSQLYWAALRPTFADRSKADLLQVQFTELTSRRGGDIAGQLMTPLGAFDFWDEVASIAVPTLIVHGDQDPTPSEVAEELAAAIDGAQLLIVEDAGHFPFLEQPDAFRRGVSAFLERLPAEGN